MEATAEPTHVSCAVRMKTGRSLTMTGASVRRASIASREDTSGCPVRDTAQGDTGAAEPVIVATIARASIDGAYVDDVIFSQDYSTASESP